jgi:uncharacterized membrane protein YeiH
MPPIDPLDVPVWVECIAVGAGALFGAFSAINERMAITGVLALAAVAGVGGGIIRDTLLQTGPPVALAEPIFLPVTLVAAAVAIVAARLLGVGGREDGRLISAILLFDAVAVGLYAVIGVDKGLQLGLPIVGSVLVGVLSGTGGSVILDVLIGRPPALLRPGILLGVAAAIGCGAYAALLAAGVSRGPAAAACAVLIALTRIGAMRFGWEVGPVEPRDGRVSLPTRRRRRG